MWVTYEMMLKNNLFLALWQDLSQEASLTHSAGLDTIGRLRMRTPNWSKETGIQNADSLLVKRNRKVEP